jgi:hypothetical protein
MINNLHIIQTHIKDGNMNLAAAFYKEEMTAAERSEDFLNRRLILGKKHGFDGHMMFMAEQVTKDGSYRIIDEELMKNNPNGWADINEDILIVTKDTPGVVIGHPLADCPLVIITDPFKGVTAVGHCSAAMVDMKLPMYIVEALRDAYDSKKEEMYAYITASAGPNWTYDCYPKWATDEKIWGSSIISDSGMYKIDIKKAIISQLDDCGIAGYSMNNDDTITNPNYYSNSAASHGILEKKGRHFAVAFYKKTL